MSPRYPVWLCDVWGVVHNGVTVFAEAVDALERHRAAGGAVVLITNAPRPSAPVLKQLARLGAPKEAFDAICTSGDVTRRLVSEHAGQTLHYIGPDRDLTLFEGLDVRLGTLEEATAVVCTGLIDDHDEKPEHYDPVLSRMRERHLDMICANPDKVVRQGDRLYPCAGALAERYEALGGRVLMAGKPFPPIYDQCLELAAGALGRPVRREEALAIGDGLHTDVEGAVRNGLAMLFIAGGIHEAELQAHGGDVRHAVRQIAPGIALAGAMPALRW
ncbi:MAG: TIGR01459 family HAD-type hydrolase [Parvibaculaceae bacterium]